MSDADPTICYCMGVPRSQLEQAIRDGARTVEDLQLATTACTGCGSCRWDLEDLLRAHQGTDHGADANEP